MIEVIAGHARPDLDADEVAATLGATMGHSRFLGISALEPRIKFGLSGDEFTTMLGGATGRWRAKMIDALADHARGDSSIPVTAAPTPSDSDSAPPTDTEASPNASESTLAPRSLENRIERLLSVIPEMPEYLYDVSTRSGAVSTVFMDVTSWRRDAAGRREIYDEFYQAADEYRTLAKLELIYARRALNGGKLDVAGRRYDRAVRNLQQFEMYSDATFDVHADDLESATRLAREAYESSKAVTKFGAHFLPYPNAAYTVDFLFTIVDFCVAESDVGLSDAAKELLVDIAVDAAMQIPTDSLGSKSLAKVLENRTDKLIGSSGLHQVLGNISHDPDFKTRIMQLLATSGRASVNMITEAQLEAFVHQLKRAESSPPTP